MKNVLKMAKAYLLAMVGVLLILGVAQFVGELTWSNNWESGLKIAQIVLSVAAGYLFALVTDKKHADIKEKTIPALAGVFLMFVHVCSITEMNWKFFIIPAIAAFLLLYNKSKEQKNASSAVKEG